MNEHKRLLELTADIVTSYVEANALRAAEVANLIQGVHQALTTLDAPAEPSAAPLAKPTRSQILKSIQPSGLISFEDGRTYQILRRHLAAQGLTPSTYREKWGLPPDYPMTAPEFSEARSRQAKANGLGRAIRRSGGHR